MMEHSVIFPDHRKVCALGQGTWKMGKSVLREADEIDALRAGIELGMSVVDTAEMYGNEESGKDVQWKRRVKRPERQEAGVESKYKGNRQFFLFFFFK